MTSSYIEITDKTLFIKKSAKRVLFQTLEILHKWISEFPELNESIKDILDIMSIANRYTGHTFYEIKNGTRMLHIPNIECKFISVCELFIKTGHLDTANYALQTDIQKVINLMQQLY